MDNAVRVAVFTGGRPAFCRFGRRWCRQSATAVAQSGRRHVESVRIAHTSVPNVGPELLPSRCGQPTVGRCPARLASVTSASSALASSPASTTTTTPWWTYASSWRPIPSVTFVARCPAIRHSASMRLRRASGELRRNTFGPTVPPPSAVACVGCLLDAFRLPRLIPLAVATAGRRSAEVASQTARELSDTNQDVSIPAEFGTMAQGGSKDPRSSLGRSRCGLWRRRQIRGGAKDRRVRRRTARAPRGDRRLAPWPHGGLARRVP